MHINTAGPILYSYHEFRQQGPALKLCHIVRTADRCGDPREIQRAKGAGFGRYSSVIQGDVRTSRERGHVDPPSSVPRVKHRERWNTENAGIAGLNYRLRIIGLATFEDILPQTGQG
jgi:hypothetical protein